MPEETLNILVRRLDESTGALRKKYFRLRNNFLCVLLTDLAIFFAMGRICSRVLYHYDEVSDHIFILFFSLVTLYMLIDIWYRKRLKKQVSVFKNEYKEAFELCNRIVDATDWSSFRRRPMTNTRRRYAFETVEEFYGIRYYRFFPSLKKPSRFAPLLMSYLLFKLGILVYTAIVGGVIVYKQFF